LSAYIAQWGSMKAGSKASSTDMETIQALAAWASGFAGAQMSAGPLPLEDMDAFFYVLTKQLAYLFQAGVSEWNDDVAYYIGSYVNNGTDSVFMSASDTNSNVALTDGTKWINMISKSTIIISSVGTLDYTVLNSDHFIVVTAAPSITNYRVILPTPGAGNTGREIKVKQSGSTSAKSLYVSVTGGSNIDGAADNTLTQYICRTYRSDGTNWHTA
jgi:hypothetical protein